MNDVIILVKKENALAFKSNSTNKLGNQHQHLQNKLKFEFIDEVVEGTAWLEYEIDGNKNYALMEKYEKGYQIDIKSCLLVSDRVDVDIKITQEENPEGIPVFISTIVQLKVARTINAEEEEPEEYPNWFENAIKITGEASNLDLDVSKVGNTSTITITKKDGTQKSVEVHDGTDEAGNNGATFTPSVSEEGIISWTNDKGLVNPTPINIKGPQGADGKDGEPGDKGEKGEPFTYEDFTAEQLAGLVGPKGDKGEPGPSGQDGASGTDGITPTIGENGNWFLGDIDTGKPSRGETGPQGEPGITPTIGENGNWFLGDTDTGKPSKAKDGIFFFDNVASMKSANLKVGDYAKTAGYYSINDGGGAEYIIADDSTLTDDGGSVHDLANGLKAKLIVKDSVNVKQFGAKGDGETDDTAAIQNTINYAREKGENQSNWDIGKISVVEFKTDNYVISSLIYVPWSVSLYGNGSIIKVKTNGYAFGLNTKNGTSWELAYPNYPKNTISDFFFINFDETTYPTAKAICMCSGSIVKNMKFRKMYESISSPNKYIDNRTIENILCDQTRIGDSYDIKLYSGDGLEINNIAGASIYLNNIAGASIRNNISCDYKLQKCRAISISNDHQELDKTNYIDASEVTFENCYFYKNTNPIFNIDSTNSLFSSIVLLKNITFNIIASTPLSNIADDIKTNYLTNLKIDNVRETFAKSSGHDSFGTTVRINGVDINPLYTNALIYKGRKEQNSVTITTNLSDYNGIINYLTGTDDDNSIYQNNTYYFKSNLFIDNVRLVRRATRNAYSYTEKSITIGENKQKLTYIFSILSQIPDGYLRIYRGTEQNSYDSYIDIPTSGIFIDRLIYDYGNSINGRYEWLSRTTGGIDDTIKTDYYEILPTGNVKIRNNNIPNYGTWTKGDIIINSSPTSGGIYGWICTESGTPGTWKTIGTIGE